MAAQSSQHSSRNRPLEWLYFVSADVQTGFGPFLAAHLSASGWNPGRVGYVLTFQGVTTVAFQTPAGAVIDSARRKRLVILLSLLVLATGALLLAAQAVVGVLAAGLLWWKVPETRKHAPASTPMGDESLSLSEMSPEKSFGMKCQDQL